MTDYEKKYSELARDFPFIANNEEQKAKRFAVDLNPKIKTYIALIAHTQYAELVEVAIRVERSVEVIPKPENQLINTIGRVAFP